MKKTLFLLVMLTPFLTGCADVDTMLTINDDNSASVVSSVTYTGDLSNTDVASANYIAKIYPKFTDSSYDVKTAFGKNLSTVTATKDFKNIKYDNVDLSTLGFETKLPNNKFIEIRKNFIITSYNVDAVFDYKKQAKAVEDYKLKIAETTAQKLTPEYLNKYGSSPDSDTEFDLASNLDDSAKMLMMQDQADDAQQPETPENEDINLTFSIKVPALASYNNADSMKGSTYYWEIKKDEPTEIKFQYVRYSGFAFVFIILVGILILAYIAKRIIRRDTTKRIDNIENIV